MTTEVKERKVVREVIAWNPPVEWVKEKIEKAGTTIGSVHFKKRGNGELRKMCYRLHVTKPSVALAPKGKPETKLICIGCGQDKELCAIGPYKTKVTTKKARKVIDMVNNQLTVLDANKVVRDDDGKVIGRGAWRCVPLENVTRISNKGVTYLIERSSDYKDPKRFF